ncbi:MAG: purine-nucleoside phosphorylase [Bacteroidales bacterium]|nr:purine-nucleoside phosphorylase [Bacteroidales bacterium]MBN2820603.1 purine-nucleoside phosphorylase [Bacteroidales bacterium]
MLEKINEAISHIRAKGVLRPEIGIILGTGLGQMVSEIESIIEIDYADIPHFPVSTVESHKGRLIYGTIQNKTVLAMQGRFHYYEGYSLQEITFPVRVMKLLGIKYLLISNAAGSMNPEFKKGDLMLLDDHINFLPDNPLRGKNHDNLGPRFPDMSQPYSKELNNTFIQVSKQLDIDLKKGVYVAVMGPNLETRAEYRMFRQFADAVGMSTVPEVIVANQMTLPCAAISVLTDECDPDNLKPAILDEILAVAEKAEKKLTKLFVHVIKQI